MKYKNTEPLIVQTYSLSASRVNNVFLNWNGERLRRPVSVGESDTGFACIRVSLFRALGEEYLHLACRI